VEQASLTVSRVDLDTVCVRVAGAWRLRRGLPAADAVVRTLDERVRRLVFDARDLAGWDSSLVTVLAQLLDGCRGRLEVERAGLPAGVQHLLALVEAGLRPPVREGAR